jgi:hypothetical protein
MAFFMGAAKALRCIPLRLRNPLDAPDRMPHASTRNKNATGEPVAFLLLRYWLAGINQAATASLATAGATSSADERIR